MALPRTDSGVHGFMHPEMRTMHNLGVALNRVEVKSGLSNGRWKTSKDIWIEALRRGLADSSGGATGDIADLIGRAFIPPERYDEALEQGVVSEGVFAVCVQVVGTRGAQRADHTIGLMASLRDACCDSVGHPHGLRDIRVHADRASPDARSWRYLEEGCDWSRSAT